MDRHQFNFIRFQHRQLIKDEMELIEFDKNASDQRHEMRRQHCLIRKNLRNTLSTDDQKLYSENLKKNRYFICMENPCRLCSKLGFNVV